MTPSWFDDAVTLGGLPDRELIEKLRLLGEGDVAAAIALARATAPVDPPHHFSASALIRERHEFLWDVHVIGYVPPLGSAQILAPIRSLEGLGADNALRGERVTISLDGFQPRNYPGGEVHRLLFYFGATSHPGEPEELHLVLPLRVQEGRPFVYLAQPLFAGLTVGGAGVDLRCLTLPIVDPCDEQFLAALGSDFAGRGMRLLSRPQPAAELASAMALRIAQRIRRSMAPVQKLRLGLGLTSDPRQAPLRAGTFVAAQVPPSDAVVWDWDDWHFHLGSGQIVGRRVPREIFPFNYLLITVDPLAPVATAGRRTTRGAGGRDPETGPDPDADPWQTPASPAADMAASGTEHDGHRDPPPGAPPDLTLRVEIDARDGKRCLRYVLNSELADVQFFEKELQGPELKIPPEEYQRDLLMEMERLARKLGADDELLFAEEIEKRLIQKGRRLYTDLFPFELKQIYRKIRDRICTIQIVSEDPFIPWELLKPYDDDGPVVDDDFLCLRFELTRWYPNCRRPPKAIRVGRLAAVHAGHVSGLRPLPRADEELAYLSRLALRLEAEDRSIRDVVREDLERLLEQGGLNLLHIIAHGYYESDRPDEAAILTTDKRHFPSSDLIGPIATRISESRPLAFLNACLLGQQGYSLTRVGGWARAFVDAGCSAFVGPQWSVNDNLTFNFARTFYDQLVDGRTLGQAARAARHRAYELERGSLAWLAPVIYAHPNARLAPANATDLESSD